MILFRDFSPFDHCGAFDSNCNECGLLCNYITLFKPNGIIDQLNEYFDFK